jgi:hypothetical protein
MKEDKMIILNKLKESYQKINQENVSYLKIIMIRKSIIKKHYSSKKMILVKIFHQDELLKRCKKAK